jgi:YggT family protein
MVILAEIISWIIRIYQFLVFVRVLLSWVNTDPYRPAIDHPLVRLLERVTEPVLAPLRRLIPLVGGRIDISPIVALFALEIVRIILVSILYSL